MKKTAILGLIFLVPLYFLVGCGQISKTMQSWVGHSSNELISSWGPPSQVFDDRNGGKVFVYAESRSWVQPGTSTTYTTANAYNTGYGNVSAYGTSTTVYNPARVEGYTAYRTFFIDSSGTIYSWSWKGM